jgi:hypothetical protein
MVGAVINSLRFELHDTGELPYYKHKPCQGCEENAAPEQQSAHSAANK